MQVGCDNINGYVGSGRLPFDPKLPLLGFTRFRLWDCLPPHWKCNAARFTLTLRVTHNESHSDIWAVAEG